jgi:hypothetical protein
MAKRTRRLPRHPPGQMLPANNSLMLTRLAGEKARCLPRPRCARMDGSPPEPPGSIARGR